MLNYYRFFIRFNLNHLLIATVFPRFSVFYSGFCIKNENMTDKCRQNKNMTNKCKLYILQY